jgi:DNA-binding MarR family transcriptional regulator
MKPEPAPAFDVNELDDLVHGRMRLGIMAYLAGAGEAEFTTLKQHLRATNGNLSVHLGKLEEGGLVALDRSIVGKRTCTIVRPTAAGREALRAYVERMAKLVEQLS